MPALIVATGPIGRGADGDAARALFTRTLSHALGGVAIELRAALTYSELLGWVGRREVHVAWLGPALFVHAYARFGVEPLARLEREGHASFRGALFVRESASCTSIESLRGARVAWVDPDSCAGFSFPRIALARQGFDPDRHFGELRILGSHAAVVRAVASEQVDVGATYVELEHPSDAGSAIVRSGWSGAGVAMRAVVISDPIPGDVVVATGTVDASLRERIAGALRSLETSPEGAAVLRALFQAVRMTAVAPDDYEPVRYALRAAGVRV